MENSEDITNCTSVQYGIYPYGTSGCDTHLNSLKQTNNNAEPIAAW